MLSNYGKVFVEYIYLSKFKNNSLLLNQLRPFGFNLIEKNSFLKKQITEFAMGFN